MTALPPPLRERADKLFFQSPTYRRTVAVPRALLQRARGEDALDIAHLAQYEELVASGPLQRDEALMLNALVRTLRPATVVELGFLEGHSALNFLTALPADSRLYSFDISDRAEWVARNHFAHFPNFTFRRRSQDEIEPADVDGRPLEFVFLDASHDFELNRRTFERLVPMLSPDAVMAVHDTGAWHPDTFAPLHHDITAHHPTHWLEDGTYQHQPEERQFVNWVREHNPEFAQLQLHTARTLRHGLTLLQRSRPLPTGQWPATGGAPAPG